MFSYDEIESNGIKVKDMGFDPFYVIIDANVV